MIKFTKMEGLGNDYVYIDCTKLQESEVKDMSRLAKIMSDRHFRNRLRWTNINMQK